MTRGFLFIQPFFYGYSFISRYVVIWYKVYLQDCIFPFISDGDI